MILNMLIAMMGKTFDVVYEMQDVNYMFLWVQTVMEWRDAYAAPPPCRLSGANGPACAATAPVRPARAIGENFAAGIAAEA